MLLKYIGGIYWGTEIIIKYIYLAIEGEELGLTMKVAAKYAFTEPKIGVHFIHRRLSTTI